MRFKAFSLTVFVSIVFIMMLSGCATPSVGRSPASAVSWETSPKIQSKGNVFQVDAIALLQSPIDQVLANATDYEHYATNNVPTVQEAHIVTQSGNDMVVWFHTMLDDRTAEYYVKIHTEKNPASTSTSSALTVSWALTPGQSNWPYPENQAVKQLSGSWIMDTVASDSSNAGGTHVIYHLLFEPNTSVPSFILRHFIDSAFTQEAVALFQLMAK